MSETSSNTNSNDAVWFAVIVLIAVGIILKKVYESFVIWFNSINWILFFIKFIIFLGIISFVFLIIFLLIKRFRKIKEHKRYLQSENVRIERITEEIFELIRKDYSFKNSEILSKDHNKFHKLLEKIPANSLKRNNEIIFEKYCEDMEKIIKDKLAEEQETVRRIKAEEQRKNLLKEFEKQDFEKQVQELLEFKISKKSEKVVPVNKKYGSEVIREAGNRAYRHFEKLNYEKEARDAAIEYYGKNDLDTIPASLNFYEGYIFPKVREEILNGGTKLKKFDYSGGKLEKYFYRAKGLREDIKKRVLVQGFKHVRGVDLDGKVVPGGFYIKKVMEKESDYHFYMKHLFAEFNQQIKVEYCIAGKRIDAAYIYKKMSVGVEIETGTNNDKQIIEKVDWMNTYFNFWIIICSRDLVPRYSKYVDNSKSFCFTPKNGKKKFRELIASIKQR